MKVKSRNLFDYAVITILIGISGNPLLSPLSKWIYVLSAAVLTIFAYFRHTPLFDKNFLVLIAASLLIFIGQAVFVDNISLPGDINFIARIYIAFLCAKMLGKRFISVYFNAIVLLSAISLMLFFLTLSIGNPRGIEFDRYKTLVVFHSIIDEYQRNSGFFWEPGAFQGYIMLAFLFYSNHLIPNIKRHPVLWAILLAALISTRSTTGYIALGTFILLFVLFHSKNRTTIIVTLLLVGLMLIPIINLDFIGEKISNEIDATSELSKGYVSWSRTGSMIIDFDNILRHPVFGNGFLMEERYQGLGEMMNGAGNGLSGSINMLGIPFILMFFYLIFKNLYSFRMPERLIVIVVLILILSGEYFLNYPLLWSLLFISFPRSEDTRIC